MAKRAAKRTTKRAAKKAAKKKVVRQTPAKKRARRKPVRRTKALAVGPSWPFPMPWNTATFTVKHVVDALKAGRPSPITRVTRDRENGEFLFLDDGEFALENAMLVALGWIVEQDPTLLELADMPPGGAAMREHVGDPWFTGMQE